VAALVATVYRYWAWHYVPLPGWPSQYWNSFTRIDGILLGCALGITFALIPNSSDGRQRILGVAGILALVVILINSRSDRGADQEYLFRYGLTVTNVGSIILVAALLWAPRSLLSRLFAAGPFVWIGRLSYSIYLFHQPVIYLLRDRAPLVYSNATYRILIVVSLTLLISCFSYYVVAQRAAHTRRRLASRRAGRSPTKAFHPASPLPGDPPRALS
jgi:peptidoglycan/LPS O-acetylase OafA/YrhL